MKRTLFLSLCVLAGGLRAQDIHWSQNNALITQNPAFTGALNKLSVHVNYRSQWNAVNTKYATYLLAGDYRFGGPTPGRTAFSAGGFFYHDVTGDGNVQATSGQVTFSCLVQTSEHWRGGAGLGYGLQQNVAKLDNFTWGQQFNGFNYDPSLASGEAQGTQSKSFSDLNAGVSMVYEKNPGTLSSGDDTRLIFGYSMHHINQPNISLMDGTDKLHVKQVLFASGLVGLKNKIALLPTAYYDRQGPLNEITAGTLVRFVTSEHSKITGYKKGSAFSFGALYRVNDAIIPTMQLEKSDFVFGVSYDVNVSSLTTASRLRGGMELRISFVPDRNYFYRGKIDTGGSK